MPTENALIEFTLDAPNPSWLPSAPVISLPSYLVSALAAATRAVAYVVSVNPDVDQVVLLVPNAPAVTLPLSALENVVELVVFEDTDEAGHHYRVAAPIAFPAQRVVVTGDAETATIDILGKDLVATLGLAFAA